MLRLSFEDMLKVQVVTPSKLPEAPRQSPNIVSIYTAREIELFGGRDLGEVLSRIPSVQPFGNLQIGRGRISIRGDEAGFNNNHVLFLLNGAPLNRESYTGGIWTETMLTAIPLAIIDRIEVIRGPGSVLYGTNAFAGVINIITKEAEEGSAMMSGGYGSHDSHAFDFLTTIRAEEFRLSTAMTFLGTDGWPIRMTDSSGRPYRDRASSEAYGIIGSASWKNFSTSFYWGSSNQQTIRGTPAEYVPGSTENTKYMATLRYRLPLGEDWEARATASNVGGKTDHVLVLSSAGTPFTARYETNDSFFELNLDGSPWESTRLLVGSSLSLLTGKVPGGGFVRPWNEVWWNVYAEANYRFRFLKFIAGVQFNKTEKLAGKWVPRFGIVAEITPHLSAKLLYGEAFRAPFIAEKFVAIPALNIFGNPNLKPETVRTLDFALLYGDQNLQWSATFFWSKQKDLIVRALQADGITISLNNAESLRTYGFEFEGKMALFDDWYILGSYTYQTNESGDGIKNFTLQPNHIGKLGIGFSNRYFSIGLFDSLLSAYPDNIRRLPSRMELNPKSKLRNDLSLKISLSLNALLGIAARPSLRLEFYGSNLSDQESYLPAHPGDPHAGLNTLHAGSGVQYMFSLKGEI